MLSEEVELLTKWNLWCELFRQNFTNNADTKWYTTASHKQQWQCIVKIIINSKIPCEKCKQLAKWCWISMRNGIQAKNNFPRQNTQPFDRNANAAAIQWRCNIEKGRWRGEKNVEGSRSTSPPSPKLEQAKLHRRARPITINIIWIIYHICFSFFCYVTTICIESDSYPNKKS